MEKQKRWQLFLIVAVLILTVYNILPTVFFYSKPLKKPIDASKADKIAESIIERVDDLEKESIDWVQSFCSLIKVKPQSVYLDPKHPQLIRVTFKSVEDANQFRHLLPRAGALISFVPAQLALHETSDSFADKTVVVQRRVPIHFDAKQIPSYFQFIKKTNDQGKITDLYRNLINDRTLQIGITLGGVSENALSLQAVTTNVNLNDPQTQEMILLLSQNLTSFVKVFGENSSIAQRYFANFTQTSETNQRQLIQNFSNRVTELKDKLKLERISIEQEAENLKAQGGYLETVKQQRLDFLASREKTLTGAETIIKKNLSSFVSNNLPWTYTSLMNMLQETALQIDPQSKLQILSLEGRNPIIERLVIDWNNEKIYLKLYPDIIEYRKRVEQNKNAQYYKDQIDQSIYNEIASAARVAGENILPYQDKFEIKLSELPNSESFLVMKIGTIAKAEIDQIKETLQDSWNPSHPDLRPEVFPIWDYETYQSLPQEQRKLGLVLYSPATLNSIPPQGFRMNSIYVVAKGVDKILERLRTTPESEQAKQFIQDFNKLHEILQRSGFFGYSANTYGMSSEFAGDFIFEAEDYFQTVIKATREDFTVHGTKRYAVLDFTNLEQRILTLNKIETRMHEDLLKWRDDYHGAQQHIKGTTPYDIPAPTKNVLWDNFKLSFIKYFRGDDRKILHWGLDLSGGKTVQIELRDNNNRTVTNETDLKQGINELYNRVNKMGVSEVSIRQEGNYITLDFPGSQGLSASELVKASSMYFHIVNEKFSTQNSILAQTVNRFLQDIWNEAVVTNHKDAEEINLIAYRHLYGDALDTEIAQPRSDAAKLLYDNGFRMANPSDTTSSSGFNDGFSKIALLRGTDYTQWYGQTHPLLVVFRNYALEGSNLENIHASYDPSKGNFLAFGVKGTQTTHGGQKHNARDDLQAWTSQFSKEKIIGTPLESYSQGRGWRMAVILNGTVISAPALDSALSDSAMITGSFTQREVNQLEADLKAGSLSFTPHILSEKNVSPELGSHERILGILAMVIAMILVISLMIGYYRFGGVVASVAVIVNLLIMWATLQNIQATLTLASIAGIILTVGMAVDANVLVFERIREEFSVTGRIASAVHAGYKKAFSAIIDSNLTTIIAALILLHFDSGPIKGLAITLIIGIVSSLFTALFMTRYFFAGWVQNPKNKTLKMANLIRNTKFDFLKHTKITILLSTIVILIGSYLLVAQRHTIMGMDFSGGNAVMLELQTLPKADYRNDVEKALIKQGATQQDFQIRELTPSNNIRVYFSKSMQQPGHPFYGMSIETGAPEIGYAYESNPKLVWLVNALQQSNIKLTPQSLKDLDQNWTEVSGQISDTMRNSALFGLCLALICILIYITARFEFKYAISATICIAHDVIFSIAAIAILHFLKVPIQIDLNTVAALMTIVGYSLNDTIIVFDRIREDIRVMRKSSLSDVINHALNITLSRTTLTSGTTLLVLIPLIALGGSTIFGFALVMSIGVIFGTLSSLFIAAPLMLYFHRKEKERAEVTA